MISPRYQEFNPARYGTTVEEVTEKNVLPDEFAHTIAKYLMLRQGDIPEPEYVRTGINPLNMGIFRESILPSNLMESLELNVPDLHSNTSFSMEINAVINSVRGAPMEGILFDVGCIGLCFVDGFLKAWIHTDEDVFTATAQQQNIGKNISTHYLIVKDEEAKTLSLYVNGKIIASTGFIGKMTIFESRVQFMRSSCRAKFRTCAERMTKERGPNDDCCGRCFDYRVIGVAPTKGTLGDARLHMRALTPDQVHVTSLMTTPIPMPPMPSFM